MNFMLEIDIYKKSSQNKLGVLRSAFSGFVCPKRHPDALLAKTMVVPANCYQMLLFYLLTYFIPTVVTSVV